MRLVRKGRLRPARGTVTYETIPESQPMAHDVFISYSSNDQQPAMAVLHGLESAGIRCWMAPRDIHPGAIWAQAIMDGIAGSRVLVVVFSNSANRSSHVLAEVDAAVRKGAVIVPFRIEDVMPDGAMEYHLRSRHWLDALTPDLEAHVDRLADQVRMLIAPDRPQPEPATLPPLPMAKELRKIRQRHRSRAGLRALGRHPRLIGAGLLLLLGGGWWYTRPRPIRDTTFTVREVSSGGGNESTFRVTARGLRFFEGPDETAPIEQRTYQEDFRVSTTRFIKVELELSYDPPGREVRFPFACVLQREGAQVLTTIALTATVQPTWNESYHASGWGNRAAGSWEPGRYRVECRYGERLLSRDWFTVVPGGHEPPENAPVAGTEPLASLGARIAAIQLFESGYGNTDVSERVYANSFDAASARYINLEVTLAYNPAPSAVEASITCRFLRDRTDELGRATLDYSIPAGERNRWVSGGWGARSPGYWRPGEYLVACDDGTTTLGQVGFTMR